MMEDWGEGRARPWNPPFDFLPLVVRKIEGEGAQGMLFAPHWPTEPWYGRMRRLCHRLTILTDDPSGLFVSDHRINPAYCLIVAEIESSASEPARSAEPC